MANIYELAEELETSPKSLQKWLRRHGFGSGKTISSRATKEARAHFKPPLDHPMASALEERDGLGAVKRHEELTDMGDGIKVQERPKLKWGKVKRGDVDLLEMDMNTQKDFFKSLRSPSPSATTAQDTSQPQATSTKSASSSQKSLKSNPSSTQPQLRAKRVSTRRPSSTPQSQHSVFGSLASISPQLDSVTDRKKDVTLGQAEALQQMSEGVKPLKQTTHQTHLSSVPSKKLKKSKKQKKHTPSSSQSSLEILDEPSTFKELFERPEVQSLSTQVNRLKDDLKTSHEVNQQLKSRIAELERGSELLHHQKDHLVDMSQHVKSHQDDTTPSLLWEHFESFGLNAHQARFALLELLDHPQRGPELIYSLKHDQPHTLTRGFAIVCEDDVCRQVADVHARQGLIEFGEKHLCSICQGSQARGWYKRLHLTACHTDRKRLLIAGGDDHDHLQLKQLSREINGLQWEFVTGSHRVDQTSANAKVAKKSAVVLWGGTHLPHSISNVIKSAADKSQIPCFSLPPGKRSISYLCASILMLWGVITEDDLDII